MQLLVHVCKDLSPFFLPFFRPWLAPKTGPGPQSVLGRTGPSLFMVSVREPSIRSESLLVTLLERERQDSQSLCLSEILQVSLAYKLT